MKLKVYFLVLVTFVLTSCGVTPTGQMNNDIIDSEQAQQILSSSKAVLIDARGSLKYKKGHITGSINIPRSKIIQNKPHMNMLADKDKIAKTMSKAGINNSDLLLIYDNNKNMDAARLWWTLKIYGHKNVKVIGDGYLSLKKLLKVTKEKPKLAISNYVVNQIDKKMIAYKKEVKRQIRKPDPSIIILDTRSQDEYNKGSIPTAILVDFTKNNFQDNSYRPTNHIRLTYLENGIDYDKNIIIYCKTSIRGAQTYLALHNAGFRDIKLYDGAWVEWSSSSLNPIFVPEISNTPVESSGGGCS